MPGAFDQELTTSSLDGEKNPNVSREVRPKVSSRTPTIGRAFCSTATGDRDRHPLQRVIRQLPDLPGDDPALRATRQEVPHDEAALVSWRLSAHEALELLRLWMRHVAIPSRLRDCRAQASRVEDRKSLEYKACLRARPLERSHF